MTVRPTESLELIARRLADTPAKDSRVSSVRDAIYEAILKELRIAYGVASPNDLPEQRG